MILKPHHRSLLREAPMYGNIPFELRRRRGFSDLDRMGLVQVVPSKRWSFYRNMKVSLQGRIVKKLLEEIPVDEKDK